MDVRLAILGVALLFSVETIAQNIYKCRVDGRIEFSGEPCASGGSTVKLSELAAPLGHYDMNKVANLDYTIKSHLIKERITRHKHKIQRYIRKMNTEIKRLQKHQPEGDKKIIKARYDNYSPLYQKENPKTSSGQLVRKSASSPGSRIKAATVKKSSKFSPDHSTPLSDQSVNKLSGVLEDQLGNIATALRGLNTDKMSDQVNAVTQRYSALIKAEEFQISILIQELRDLRE